MKAHYQEHREKQRRSALRRAARRSDAERDRGRPRAEALADLDERWRYGGAAGFMLAFTDVLTVKESNDVVAEFVRSKIREKVKDPAVAERLCPTTYPIATKRICVDIDYFETYNRDNVTLVDIRETPIVRNHAERGRDDGRRHRGRRDHLRDRVRRDDGRAARHRHPRRGRPAPRGRVAGRAAHVPRADGGRVPEPVHDHGAGKPVGVQQHGRVDRAGGRVDRRLRRLDGGERLRGRRARRPRRRPPGSPTSPRSPTRRCSRKPTRGTWERTCRASRASSRRTSAGSGHTGRSATRSPPRATRALPSTGPRCARPCRRSAEAERERVGGRRTAPSDRHVSGTRLSS